MSFERRCSNSKYRNSFREESARGEIRILGQDGSFIGSFKLSCPAWKDYLNLQLFTPKSKLAARTMTLPGSAGGGKQIYLMDCNGDVVFVMNVAADEINYQEVAENTYLTVFEPLGAFPVAYVSSMDFQAGRLLVRNEEGTPKALVTAKQGSVDGCDFPQWEVVLPDLSDSSLASDPRVISLILSYLALSADAFNGCTELAWNPFGFTFLLPAFLMLSAGIYKMAKRKEHPYAYVELNAVAATR